MRFTLFTPLAFALAAFAAPTSDCESLKSLSTLKGAQIFCAEKYPAAAGADVPTISTVKSNAKRFKEDDERVVRILGRMPESRQKAFCACYPAVAHTSVSVSVSATPSASSAASVEASSTLAAVLSTPTSSVAQSASASATVVSLA